MNNLIILFKDLYTYCTDFIINLANITGLSYYEVNFMIFIIIFPLLLIISATLFIIQKKRIKSLKNEQRTSLIHINTFNKRLIFFSSNIVWLIVIILGTSRVFSESTSYYTKHLSNGDYAQQADSISIPIMEETFFVFLILSLLLVFMNVFIFLMTRKTKLPTKLFIKADFFSVAVVLWELFFAFWIAISLFLFVNWVLTGYYIESVITLFYTFILLNLRAGRISNYKKTEGNYTL